LALPFNKIFRKNASIWVVIGAIVVVAVIASVMTLAHFQRQKEQAVELMMEKGATLIRSFEAGLRTQAFIKNGAFGLQKLLMETAQQPDIDYIIVTNSSGKIIADSDPASIDDNYGLDLDIKRIASSKNIQWRQVTNPEGAGTFEVYRGFFPQERFDEPKAAPKNSPKTHSKSSMIIYVGFNMAAIEKAGHEDTRDTIIIALILLLIGSSAIVSLFLAQAYQSTRTSLSRITVFSEALVANMPIGLIALDERGLIATCNEEAGTILNIDCSTAQGHQAESIVPASVGSALNELSETKNLVEKDLQLTAFNNAPKTLEVVAAALTDKGKSIGKIILLRDVTTIRQLENEIAKSRHLNSIGSLAAGVAHEIRNPLSSIKGFAVYFKERLAGNEEDQKTADIMIREVERLNRVISQLIEFARPLELKREKLQFRDLISHTIALIDAEAKQNHISLVVAEAPYLPAVEGDPDKIKQVLLNIFLNSLAALKKGGQLSVNFSTGPGHMDMIIADTGIGIDQIDLPRIYDPYFTSKPAGTGLGLAVVQKIMEAHGGRINVDSTAGKGTTVILRFPVAQ
jgi:two-component system sensor histidine kinase HydH